MADLTALIRLHKHELDQKQQALGKLYQLQALLESEEAELDRVFKSEKDAFAASDDVHFTFASYIEKVKQQKLEFAEKNEHLEKVILEAKDSLMETFSELKKYEMAHEKRMQAEEKKRAAKESQEMDEIGLEGFRRKNNEE